MDFEPISLIFLVPLVIVAHPDFPANSLAELIALAKKDPGKYSYASAGPGTSQHLSMELFKSKAELDIVHVPYKGSGPAMADLLGGHIQLMMDSTASAQSAILDKRIKALAVTTARRAPAPLDGIPSIGDTIAGYDTAGWAGLVAPAHTPPEIVGKISTDVQALLHDPAIVKSIEAKAGIAAPTTPGRVRSLHQEGNRNLARRGHRHRDQARQLTEDWAERSLGCGDNEIHAGSEDSETGNVAEMSQLERQSAFHNGLGGPGATEGETRALPLRYVGKRKMPMKRILVAAVVLSALPAVAQAQSSLFTPNYQPFPGVYVGAQGGLNWLLNSNNYNMDTGYAVGGVVGYDFVGPRVELEGVYRSNNGSGTANFRKASQSAASINQLSVMANLLYDFFPGATITPYVGAGAGIAFVDRINGSRCAARSSPIRASSAWAGTSTPSFRINLDGRYYGTTNPRPVPEQQHHRRCWA